MATIIKKERLITRTITRNVVKVMGFNWAEMQTEERSKTITGKLDEMGDRLFILSQFASENYAPHHIVSMESKEVRYGLSESDFIKYGHILSDDEAEETE